MAEAAEAEAEAEEEAEVAVPVGGGGGHEPATAAEAAAGLPWAAAAAAGAAMGGGGGRGGIAAAAAAAGRPRGDGRRPWWRRAASAPGGTARSTPAERGIDRGAAGSAYAARPGGTRHEGQKHDGHKHGQKHFKDRCYFNAFAFGAPLSTTTPITTTVAYEALICGAWRRARACAHRWGEDTLLRRWSPVGFIKARLAALFYGRLGAPPHRRADVHGR